MRTYTMTDLRRNSNEIAEALEAGESIRLTHYGKPLGTIVPESQEVLGELEQVSSPVFEEMLQVQREILAELRASREPDPVPEDTWPRCDCGRPVSEHHDAFTRKLCAGCLIEQAPKEPDLPTVAWDSTQAPPEGGWTTAGYTTEEGPEQVLRDAEPQEPAPAPIPSERQLAYAQDFYGLLEAQGDLGWALTEKGVNNALGTMRKHARNGEELAVEMSPKAEDDPERMAYLTLLQIQKYESCLAKLRAGDPNWVSGGPSS